MTMTVMIVIVLYPPYVQSGGLTLLDYLIWMFRVVALDWCALAERNLHPGGQFRVWLGVWLLVMLPASTTH